MNPSPLVTGGAGFVGSHRCERRVAAGHKVLCVDNFHTGTKDNIHHLLGNNRFEFIRHDVWLTKRRRAMRDSLPRTALPSTPPDSRLPAMENP